MNISIQGVTVAAFLLVNVGLSLDLAVTLHHKDRLLEHLYSARHGLWMELGFPIGWKWQPPKSEPISDKVAFTRYRFEWWSKREPAWLAEAPEIRDNYRRVSTGIKRWTYIGMPSLLVTAFVALILLR